MRLSQPLLGSPECQNNFLKTTTVLEHCQRQFHDFDGRAKGRRDSFCTVGIPEEETESARVVVLQ